MSLCNLEINLHLLQKFCLCIKVAMGYNPGWLVFAKGLTCWNLMHFQELSMHFHWNLVCTPNRVCCKSLCTTTMMLTIPPFFWNFDYVNSRRNMLNNKLPLSEVMHILYCCHFVFVDFFLKSQIYENIQKSIAMVFFEWLVHNVLLYKTTLKEILSFATKKSMIKCPKWLIFDCNNKTLLQILCVKVVLIY